MRIDRINVSQVESTGPVRPKALEADGATATPGALPSSEDAVDSRVADLAAKAMDQPEVRMDRVETIKAQIAAGTYEVDPAKIADAIISENSK